MSGKSKGQAAHGWTRRAWLRGVPLLFAPLAANTKGSPNRRRLSVGAEENLRTLSQALGVARDGDTIELRPGVYRGDVAAVEQHGLVIRGLGAGAVLLADGRHAEGKAILVTRGSVVLENLEFRGSRVPSGNGAGVRFERGHLQLRRCRFHDNEMGLLSSNDPEMTLSITDCEFGSAPRHAGPLHHLLYVGTIRALRVEGSLFQQGWRGHLLKSRARNNIIVGNRLVDGPLGEASYELEFPNGGDALVAGNVIAQSATTQNTAIVSMGAEAEPGAGARLRLVHNTLVNHARSNARFVHMWTDRLASETPVLIARNLFVGEGSWPRTGDERLLGNHVVALGALVAAEAGDYRLQPGSPLWQAALAPPPGSPPLLRFTAPWGAKPMPAGALAPGALQWGD